MDSSASSPLAGGGAGPAGCRVLERRVLTADTVALRLQAPEIAARAQAGQFVQALVPTRGGGDPFLRRPISLASIWPDRGEVELVVRAVGQGTTLLTRAEQGSDLDLLGPLGRPFPLPESGKALLVGGGTGSAPLLALATAIAGGQDSHTIHARLLMLCGARTAAELWAPRMAAERGLSVLYSTDDGSAGHPGLVTDLVRSELSLGQISVVYACGPLPMLQVIRRISLGTGVPLYVSLEQHMACGVGACRGCSWPRADGSGYLRVCRDGPVFRAEEVAL